MRIDYNMKCACYKTYIPPLDFKDVLDFHEKEMAAFVEVRNYCCVLQHVIPDDVFQTSRFTHQQFDNAQQFSKFFIAFTRNNLSRLTEALHAFLFDYDGKLKRRINPSYASDLKENWIVSTTNDVGSEDRFGVELKKHQNSRIHDGKLHELIFAHDISKVAKIENLEAWDKESPDILINTKSMQIAIEVKYIGEYDNYFEARLREEATYYSPEKEFAYVVARLCEASGQLMDKNIGDNKVAVIMYDAFGLRDFKWYTVNCGFSFCNPDISKHKDMLGSLCMNKSKNKIERMKDIFANPRKYLDALNGYWIISSNAFRFNLEFESGVKYPLI